MEIKGLCKDNILAISRKKKEDDWVLNYRLDSYSEFCNLDMPSFGPEITLNFDDIIYYKTSASDDEIKNDWNQILKPVKDELDHLGVIESERHLDGIGVQYESEVIYT